jgi:hypothetical protein
MMLYLNLKKLEENRQYFHKFITGYDIYHKSTGNQYYIMVF